MTEKKNPAPALPDWIEPVEGRPERFLSDPEKFYPAILQQMQDHPAVEFDGTVDQYWLEVAYNVMKLDFYFELKRAGTWDELASKGISPVHAIRGGEGYKEKWRLDSWPEGALKAIKKERGDDWWRHVARASRDVYKAMRGFLPA